MPFGQPENDPLAHERLSILVRYAAEHAQEEARVRETIPEDQRADFELFLRIHKDRGDGEERASIASWTTDAYRKAKAREGAQRLIAEEQAAERGSVSSHILTYEQACELKPPAPLIPNVIYTGAVGVILGDSQVGKSWVMLSIAAAAATGLSWPTGSKDVTRRTPMPVLYVAAEDGATVTARLQQWETAHNESLRNRNLHIHPSAINLLDDVQIDEVCEAVAERGYKFIVFDTVAASLGGEEEGNPQFSKVVQSMRRVLRAMDGQGAVYLVHHFGKDKTKGARGGSSLFNDSDVFWELHGSLGAMDMRNTKWKIGRQRHTWRLRLDETDESMVCIKADLTPASVRAPVEEDKYKALNTAILKVVKERADANQGFGPSRNVIRESLKKAGAKFREAELTPRLEMLVADRVLYAQSGPRSATWYRLPPVQEEVPE